MIIFSQNKALILGMGISSLLHIGVIMGGQLMPQVPQMSVLKSENTNSFQIVSLPTVVISPKVVVEENILYEEIMEVNNFDDDNSTVVSAAKHLSNSAIEQVEQLGSETTAKPLNIVNSAPLYPKKARLKGFEGTVVLSVLVTAEGLASNVKVNQTSGHYILDNAAISAVEKWKFEPAKIHTLPIESMVKIPIDFVLGR